MTPLVLFGGTFDPVHLGHLKSALDVCEHLQLSQIHLVPNGQPPHRQATGASSQQRLEMLELAVVGYDRLVIDLREVQRQGNSYMIDTLQELRQLHGPHQAFILCMGNDAVMQLTSWNRWQQLSDYTNLLILQRPGMKSSANLELMNWQRCDDPSQLMHWSAGYFSSITLGQYDIAATNIRTSIASGQSLPEHWLTPAVATYIAEHRLYKD